MRHPRGPNMEALLEERKPGCCAACDEPLPTQAQRTRERIICHARECVRVYQAAWRADWRNIRRAS